jgi:acyl-coenzyme A synthetase/AMP-(fatty) acid ligase
VSPLATALLALKIQSATADPARPALVDTDDPSRSLSHGELSTRVSEVAAYLPAVENGRCLVHVPLTTKVDAVVGYLAVLLAGHVALVTGDRAESIAARYRPDLVLQPDGGFRWASTGPQHVLHPSLALLLSTSGSTGSPKLVRLSQDNLLSNADAIAAALSVTPADRAITLLPLHYCFGLSVLHTQLRAGATVVLRAGSPADPDVGDVLVRHRVSILPATPHVVDLLDVQGVLRRGLPDVRIIAQAGGALAPDRVAAVSALGRSSGAGAAGGPSPSCTGRPRPRPGWPSCPPNWWRGTPTRSGGR